jgi:UDP:flavonoid glycosyltransferase YjiC (YdhE family)
VCHGGSGTVLAALAHGLPLLVLPQGANQFWNAERCASLGAGVALHPSDLSPERVRHQVRRLVDEPSYRQRAGQIRDEIQRMPNPADVVPLLEGLAEDPSERLPQ